ncbi:conjugal transfer pilus assembly protein TraU [Rickettsia endosymbiont of Culicoides newsteadi]|uniref:conjugal transfer pilus assembly protein TraU n=1 Tax=Rickettsia endosymbiont of Culicoides newsteadi TaxID=1961830 RepID=UPI000BC4435D|nr:conjugal transfer pilus assembly protein TraU [Rickettsia endosymbiont of Culicoides newsteadi]OZG32428.1 sex pilus assembly [Rickettsia endosymbiont of Culicoides newsteadi]
MSDQTKNLTFGEVSFRSVAKGWMKHTKVITILIMVIFLPLSSYGNTCQGRFVNPITDICWSCLLPISIGGFNIGKGSSPKKRDTKNPSSPLCLCTKGNVPIPGIAVGFWEPVRLVDITRTPYCMVNLGGLSLGTDLRKVSSYARGYGDHHAHRSFYHVHYYIYPLIYWLELITDFICLEQSSFDVGYISELDVAWNDEKLQTLLNPEVFLFGNHLAQAACSIDCAASTVDLPRDEMFWCAGCWGNIYPFSGANSDHVGGIQSSSLYATRILAKMHRIGLAQETSTSQNTSPIGGGELCRKSRALKIKKSQYKLQMVNPVSTSSGIGCFPLGLSDMLYSAFKEYPYDGQDFGYLIFRKVNCCAF